MDVLIIVSIRCVYPRTVQARHGPRIRGRQRPHNPTAWSQTRTQILQLSLTAAQMQTQNLRRSRLKNRGVAEDHGMFTKRNILTS
jgi:hypothetical protein